MSEVVVVAVITAAEGSTGALEAAIRDVLIPGTHAEEGCLRFAVHRDVGNPARIVLIERWTSRAALDAHLKTPHITRFRAAIGDLLGAPTEVLILEPELVGDPVKGLLA